MFRLLSSFFVLFLCAFSFLASADDSEDKSYENRIHNIYLKHYKNPVTNTEWSGLINVLKKSYQLQYKDNLWDLSKSFFKNNLYWSKLWVANPLVENPHRIYKGDSIKFDIKTLSAINSSKYSTPISKQFPDIKLSPQLGRQKALSEYEFPSSLPYIKESINLDSGSGEVHLSFDSFEINQRALLPFYLSENKLSQVGEVIAKDGYGLMSFNGENIIVRVEDEIAVGDKYTVVKNKGSLKSSFWNLLKDNKYEIQIKGEIKILSYIVGTESLYRAEITKSLAGITKGDSILSGRSPTFTLSQKGNYGTASGVLIGVPNKKIKILSLYSIVYLGKGGSNGVRVDDLYYIKSRSDNSSRKYNRSYSYERQVIGQLRIIHVSPDVSTAIIIQASTQIYLNDFFSSSLDSTSNLEESQDHESMDDFNEQESYESKENQLDLGENPFEDKEIEDQDEENLKVEEIDEENLKVEDLDEKNLEVEEIEDQDEENLKVEEIEDQDEENLKVEEIEDQDEENLEVEALDEKNLEVEEIEDQDEENLEVEEIEDQDEENLEVEEIEDQDEENLEVEEIEEDDDEDIDGDSMIDIKNEFQDLENLEEIEDL